MSEPDISVQDAVSIGGRLSGARVAAAQPARSGGNNRVFRLEMAEGPPSPSSTIRPTGVIAWDRNMTRSRFCPATASRRRRGRSRKIRLRSARCINGSTVMRQFCILRTMMPISWPIS